MRVTAETFDLRRAPRRVVVTGAGLDLALAIAAEHAAVPGTGVCVIPVPAAVRRPVCADDRFRFVAVATADELTAAIGAELDAAAGRPAVVWVVDAAGTPGADAASTVAAEAAAAAVRMCASGAVLLRAAPRGAPASGAAGTVQRLPALLGPNRRLGRFPVSGLTDILDGLAHVGEELRARGCEPAGLRLPVPPGSELAVASLGDTARHLVAGTAGAAVPAPAGVPVETLCRMLGAAFGLDLAAGDPRNTADELLAEHTGAVGRLFRVPEHRPDAAGPDAAGAADIRAAIASYRAAAAIPAARPRPARRIGTVAVGWDGNTGEPPLVVVNALGQGPGYWTRLAGLLAPRRVLVCASRPRGPDGSVCGIDQHVADLDELLFSQGLREVHLLGWCTGAKVVLAHAARRPGGIRSLTLLSPSTRHPGRPAGLDTDYERELEALCRMVERRPAAAERIRTMLAKVAFGAGPDQEPLAAPHPDLDEERRCPFASAEAMTTYARQLLDFWSHDPTGDARAVRAVPTLLIAGAADPIVSSAAQLPVLELLDSLTRHEVPEGNHYLMHDRAELVAGLVDAFLRRVPAREEVHR